MPSVTITRDAVGNPTINDEPNPDHVPEKSVVFPSVTEFSTTMRSLAYVQPLPTKKADEQHILDILGKKMTINVKGIFKGTKAEQDTFMKDVDGLGEKVMGNDDTVIPPTHPLIIGLQSNQTIMIDTFPGRAFKGIITNVSFSPVPGAASAIPYSIEFAVGKVFR